MVVKKCSPNVIFLNQIPELLTVKKEADNIILGACVTYTDLLSHPLVPELLKQAIRKIASPAIRNAGTIGGNICNASPAGDTLPVLYALSAQVVTVRITKESQLETKRIPIEDFILGIRKIALSPNEIVSGIEIPNKAWEEMTRITYEKVGARQADAISKLSFGGLMKIQGEIIQEVSIAFGSVAVTTVRRRDIESKLRNRSIKELQEMKSQILAEYGEYIRPIDDQRSTAVYRKKVCLNLLDEFLTV